MKEGDQGLTMKLWSTPIGIKGLESEGEIDFDAASGEWSTPIGIKGLESLIAWLILSVSECDQRLLASKV